MIIKTYKPDDVFRLMTRDLRDAARAVVFIGWRGDINAADIYDALKPVFDGGPIFTSRICREDVMPQDGSAVSMLAVGFEHREQGMIAARAMESALCNVHMVDDVSGCEIPALYNGINIEMWIGDVRVDFHPSSPQRASFQRDNGGGDLK